MMEENKLPTRKENNREVRNQSWIEKTFGNDFKTASVTALFIVTLLTFGLVLIFSDLKDNNSIITGFFSLLSGLIGFFTGTRNNT